MRFSLKARLVFMIGLIAVFAGIIGLSARTIWLETRQLEQRFDTVHLESFEIADHLQATVLRLRNNILRFAINHRDTDLEKFAQDSQNLNQWIEKQRALFESEQDRELFSRIDAAYDVFLTTATNALSEIRRSQMLGMTFEGMEKNVEASINLLDLGFRLAEAHRAALVDFVAKSRQSFAVFQRLIYFSLFVLIGLGVGLFVIVYRELIAPLRLQLVESQNLIERQEKLASLGVLAAGVAHEIRNPLTAIRARLFTLRKHLSRGSPPSTDAEVIDGEIRRLERIVKDFLLFARPSEPKLEVIPALDVVREVAQLFASPLERKHIRIIVEESPEMRVQADSAQLKQVLINLVQNAEDAIGSQGEIRMRARGGHARFAEGFSESVILEVEDNGKGIPPEVQKRLFDPFFSTKEAGTGLGLSIAARIVEKHRGLLQYRSQVARGTVFGIVLRRFFPHEAGTDSSR